MTETEFNTRRWHRNERVMCGGKEFRVHSVNFESGMIGVHSDSEVYEVLYKSVETVTYERGIMGMKIPSASKQTEEDPNEGD